MTLEISLPILGKKKTVKDHIISILSTEWPLSLKKTHSILRKQYQLDVSYQACHKALKELLIQNIIVKGDKGYQLNLKWIHDIKEFGSKIEKIYNCKESIRKLQNGQNISIINFETLFELDKFIIDFTKNRIPIKSKVFAFYEHVWVPLFHSKEGYSDLKTLKNKNRFFIACRCNTKIDKWCIEYYKKIGINARTNVKIRSNCDFLVTDGILVQLFYPSELRNKIDSVYQRSNDIEHLDLQDFFENILEKKTGINVVIIKKEEIVNRFREELLSYIEE